MKGTALERQINYLERKLFAAYEARIPKCSKLQEKHMQRIECLEVALDAVKQSGLPYPRGLSLDVAITAWL